MLIAGDARPTFRTAGCSLLDEVALWSFHGDRDSVVDIAWTRTYDLSAGHDIYAWLLAQRR